MAEELGRRLKEWGVDDFHVYLKYVRDAQKQGFEGEDAIKWAKDK